MCFILLQRFGVGNGTIFLSGLKCSSRYQQHLLRCKHSGIGSPTYHYTHDQDVAIFCSELMCTLFHNYLQTYNVCKLYCT